MAETCFQSQNSTNLFNLYRNRVNGTYNEVIVYESLIEFYWNECSKNVASSAWST